MPAHVARVYSRSRTLRLVDFFLLKKLLANLPILCPGENIIFTNLFKIRLSTWPSSLLTSDMSLDITKTTFSFDNSLYEFTEPTQSYYTRGYDLLQWIWFVLSQWSYGQKLCMALWTEGCWNRKAHQVFTGALLLKHNWLHTWNIFVSSPSRGQVYTLRPRVPVPNHIWCGQLPPKFLLLD